MSEIKPALTEKEWADGKTEKGYGWAVVGGDLWLSPPGDDPLVLIQNRHAAAALCLHEQPFGFTREDVDGLRIMMQREGPHIHMYGSVATLADRIEALLPPKEKPTDHIEHGSTKPGTSYTSMQDDFYGKEK